MIVTWAFKEFSRALNYPGNCKKCGGSCWQSWSKAKARKVIDTQETTIEIKRWRCSGCGKTATVRPAGVTKSPQSPRLKAIVVLLYVLGLSYRGVSTALAAFGLSLSYVSGWRDVQGWGELLRSRPKGHARVVGIDETYVKMKGKLIGVGIAIDIGNGHTLMVELTEVDNPGNYVSWLRSCAEELGAEVVVSDDSPDYKVPVDEIGLHQQLCLVHVQRTVARNVRKLSGEDKEVYTEVIQRLKSLVRELPDKAVDELWALAKRELPEKLRGLVIYLLNNWHKMVLFRRDKAIPTTNNRTEQAILRTKLRYRTTRGLKSPTGVLNFFAATQDVLSEPWQVRAMT